MSVRREVISHRWLVLEAVFSGAMFAIAGAIFFGGFSTTTVGAAALVAAILSSYVFGHDLARRFLDKEGSSIGLPDWPRTRNVFCQGLFVGVVVATCAGGITIAIAGTSPLVLGIAGFCASLVVGIAAVLSGMCSPSGASVPRPDARADDEC